MLRVGLTGGLACGKSAVAQMFARRGAHVIHADVLAHELMEPGQPVYENIVRSFGKGILNADGTIDRKKLAQAAFGAGRIEELNRVVHPAVIERQEAWMMEVERQDPAGIALVEAALIVEAGVADRFDRVVVVTCTEEQKVERYAARSRERDKEQARAEAKSRMAAQLPDGEKAKAAHYIIDNSGALEATATQVEHVYAQLKKLVAAQAKTSQQPKTRS